MARFVPGSSARDSENKGRVVSGICFSAPACGNGGRPGVSGGDAGGWRGAQPERHRREAAGPFSSGGGRRERIYRGSGVAALFCTVALYF